MYRYSVDNAITYTSEDLVLFKESPFACWMERLTLENPHHGILPNDDDEAPRDSMDPQDDLADTLRAEGKEVVLVEWESPEPQRRSATVEAMREGTDFIVDGQLALGSLSGSANLLMRTSGYSDLGNYLYVPCNTQKKMNLHSALRLCFLADLLHSLQGQLSPQMLIIRGGSDVVPLQTEDHIYHYRAVKQRFMTEQLAFRKHRMPDPAESSHFGRWSNCANEVMKQRALRTQNIQEEELDQPVVYQQRHSASSGSAYDLDEVNQLTSTPIAAPSRPLVGATLAEQARNLAPVDEQAPEQPADTLQNLSFIGASTQAPTIGQPPRVAQLEVKSAPEARLRQSDYQPVQIVVERRRVSDAPFLEARPEVIRAEPEVEPENEISRKPHPLDSPGFQPAPNPSMVDLDRGDADTGISDFPPSVPASAPVLEDLSELARERSLATQADESEPDSLRVEAQEALDSSRLDTFSSSLMTSDEFDQD